MTASKFIAHNDNYAGLHLFNETAADLPLNQQTVDSIADAIQQEENCSFKLVEIVFVDETEIVRINKEHLERDYITDIISFRYDDNPENTAIEGTLFCCAPRITEQAKQHNEPAEKEFRRIVIHGMLHLTGYGDQSPSEKTEMRQKEDLFLS